MTIRTINWNPFVIDTAGAPVITASYLVSVDGTSVGNPTNNTMNFDFPPGAHVIEIQGIGPGGTGPKSNPFNYMEPSGLPVAPDPDGVEVV